MGLIEFDDIVINMLEERDAFGCYGRKFDVSAELLRSHGIDVAVDYVSLETAKMLYRQFYWEPLKLDDADPALRYIIFESALLTSN